MLWGAHAGHERGQLAAAMHARPTHKQLILSGTAGSTWPIQARRHLSNECIRDPYPGHDKSLIVIDIDFPRGAERADLRAVCVWFRGRVRQRVAVSRKPIVIPNAMT